MAVAHAYFDTNELELALSYIMVSGNICCTLI